jgi:hypothetical protein
VPPKDPRASAGWIIMEPADTPPMSGSNCICVATVLLETGIVPMQEPETRLVLEAPGGIVEVQMRQIPRALTYGNGGRSDMLVRCEPLFIAAPEASKQLHCRRSSSPCCCARRPQ